MGWFGSEEELVSGDLVVQVPIEVNPLVMFTLDPAGAPRNWQTSMTEVQLTGDEDSIEQIVEPLAKCGLECVKKKLPSLEWGRLTVQIQEAGGENAVFVSGSVKYLPSEWNTLREPPEGSMRFSPRR
jgi:hypothetical protein